MNELIWLQSWYKEQCDGTWEHSYGVRLDTLDNPGWRLAIDGIATSKLILAPVVHNVDDSETSWVRCSLRDGVFEGACGPENLNQMLGIFRAWMEQKTISTN